MESNLPTDETAAPGAVLDALLRATADAVVVADREGRVVFWGGSAERIFGWCEEEVLGDVAPMVHPDDRDTFVRRLHDALRGMPLRGRRTRKVGKDGAEVPTMGWHAPVGPPDEPEGVLFVLRPVLEEGSLEERLLASERRFRDLFDQTADALILHVPDGSRILEVNREACESLGYTRDELLSLEVRDVVKDPGPKEKTSRVKSLPVGERIQGITSRHRRKDGTEFPAEVQMVALEWDGRRAVLASCRDVSERHRIERSLRETNARLEALLDSAPVAIIGADRDNRLTVWNRAAEEMFGWAAEEVLGGPNPYVPEEERADYEEKMGRLVEGHQMRGSEVRRRRKDGTLVTLQIWTAPLRDESGRYVGSMAVAEDVTERRELEKRLRDARRLRTVGQLAGGVAHDFNNHLTTILSLVDLVLLDLPPDHPSRPDVEAVRDAAGRSARLTQQLLAYGRQQVLRPRVLDLPEVVRETVAMLRRLLPENVELRTEADEEVGPVRADPTQVQQVLMNLVVNARDALPDGGTIRIRLRRPADRRRARRWVALEVVDDGVGIAPEVQERMFEPFFTTKEAGEGTGLGLSTVYGIVEQSGGSVEVESEPGEGATFRILFPRARETAG